MTVKREGENLVLGHKEKNTKEEFKIINRERALDAIGGTAKSFQKVLYAIKKAEIDDLSGARS